MYRCTKCGEKKGREEFYKDIKKSSGLQSRCKECAKAWQRNNRSTRREWERRHAEKPGVRERKAAQARDRRRENPERYRAYQRKLYAQDPKSFLERSRQYSIKRRFGLTQQQYEDMVAAQDGKCAICLQNRSVRETFRLGVDHCHSTGAIRGLLCSNCNIGIGHFADSPDLLRAAADYLERTAARKSA